LVVFFINKQFPHKIEEPFNTFKHCMQFASGINNTANLLLAVLKGKSHEILVSFFCFHQIDMNLLIGPDQVYFSFNYVFVFKFLKKVDLRSL
jgi:hypothetical protein